jgi:hypothetical protein
MRELDAGNRDGRVRERLEASHRRAASLDHAVVLLDDVVEIIFRKALASTLPRVPRKVTLDGHVPSRRALWLLRPVLAQREGADEQSEVALPDCSQLERDGSADVRQSPEVAPIWRNHLVLTCVFLLTSLTFCGLRSWTCSLA